MSTAATGISIRRAEGGLDRIDLWHRILLWVLVTVGFETILYFADWWLEPHHRKNMVFFVFLTFAVMWGPFRALYNWFNVLFIRGGPGGSAPEGLKVDVYTTAMPGEPYEMFEKSLTAIASLRYPHESYLLDGGNDARLRQLCERLRIHHVDSREIKGAKAGKINHALTRTSGEFILVIDPDHVPEPDFLDKVLPPFRDAEVGFVQVVQGYSNQGESFVARASAEQTYGFYGPTMMGMNGLGTAVAIGANCTFRRKALEEIGGHAVNLAEDLLTSMRLHAGRWKSIYVPQRLSFGLTPADLHSYFKQQLKWSTGMFGVFFSHYFRHFRNLTLPQKVHYFFAGTYYLEGPAIAVTCILPIVFLFFGLWAVEMDFGEFLIHITPFVTMSILIGWFVQRWYRDRSEKGFLWRGMFLKKGTWPIYVLGLAYCLTRTRVPYLPTPKTADRNVYTSLVVPHLTVMGLSAAAVVYALLSYDRFVIGTRLMMFFAACNIVLMLPTVLVAHAPWFERRKRAGAAQ